MKTRTVYTCSICNRDYENEKSALECEARGVPDNVIRGIIWQHDGPKDLIVFVSDGGYKSSPHLLSCTVAVFRDNGYGDNWKDEGGGGTGAGYLDGKDMCDPERYPLPDLNAPASQRALKWCDERNIVPLVVTTDGPKPIVR